MESPVHPHPLSSSSSSLHYSPPQLKQYDIRTSNSKPTLTKTDSIDLVDCKLNELIIIFNLYLFYAFFTVFF